MCGDEMNKLVCGVGFNDKTRPAKVDGKHVKEYVLWTGMLERCFNSLHRFICSGVSSHPFA